MRRAAAVVLLGLLLVGCARAEGDAGSGDTGIRGVVLAGPQCPVETPESPCPPKPLADVEVQVREGGDVVAEATTDRSGGFSVAVEPGTYEVQALPGQTGFMFSRPVLVVVRSGSFAQVTVPVDTGIR